jgi:hypothetical protein
MVQLPNYTRIYTRGRLRKKFYFCRHKTCKDARVPFDTLEEVNVHLSQTASHLDVKCSSSKFWPGHPQYCCQKFASKWEMRIHVAVVHDNALDLDQRLECPVTFWCREKESYATWDELRDYILITHFGAIRVTFDVFQNKVAPASEVQSSKPKEVAAKLTAVPGNEADHSSDVEIISPPPKKPCTQQKNTTARAKTNPTTHILSNRAGQTTLFRFSAKTSTDLPQKEVFTVSAAATASISALKHQALKVRRRRRRSSASVKWSRS